MGYHLFINPAAASGKAKVDSRRLVAYLKSEGIEYHLHMPKSKAQMQERIHRITSERYCQKMGEDTHLVIVGGDGSLNVAISAIDSFEHTKLSYIPLGSGNDFARSMKIGPEPMENLLNILYRAREMQLDYGEMILTDVDDAQHRHRCMISTGVGYDADICVEVENGSLKNRLNKLKLGKLVYLIVGLRQIFARKSVGAVIRMDEKVIVPVSQMFFTVGMIQPYEGGGTPFCPEADPCDGLLDVCLVRGMPKWKLALAVMMVYTKKLYWFKAVSGYRCKKLQIKLDEPQWYHTDGEISQKIVEIALECKQGLRFVY